MYMYMYMYIEQRREHVKFSVFALINPITNSLP